MINQKTIIVDTETTGLDPIYDEILQLSIINGNGDVLYNGYFKPDRHTSWENATKINGITPDAVKNAPSFRSELHKINSILQAAKVYVGYNSDFDIEFMKKNGCTFSESIKIIDVMKDFAYIYGDWSEERKNYKWKKLSVCAEYYNYDWGREAAHNSLSDCKATLYCYKKMQDFSSRIKLLKRKRKEHKQSATL